MGHNGREACPELRNKDQHVEEKADPGADDARLGAEGELVEFVTLLFPGFAEADMGEADGAPGEDGGETGDGLHPGEGMVLGARGSEEGQEAKCGSDADGAEGAALAVDVGEEVGGLALVCKGG